MSVISITAPPGGGKTLIMTYLGIKEFRLDNPRLARLKKDYKYKINIYSNYPILLHYQKKPFLVDRNNGKVEHSVPLKFEYNEELRKEILTPCDLKDAVFYGVFSNKLNFTDMRIKYRFNFNATFLIDEIQYIYDSQDYKDFPDCIAHFFQVHRHLGYNKIYTNSQSLSRIIKRVLNVSEEFYNIIEYKKYLLLPFLSRCSFKITYDISDGKEKENKVKEDDFIKDLRFFHKRIYNAYATRYLSYLNNGLPEYNNVGYTSLIMEKSDILSSFIVSNDKKEELKKEVF